MSCPDSEEKVRQRNIAIGALLEGADADCKKLIGAYKPTETYKKNHAVMSHSIYTSAVIEKCLNYMKVETRRGPNKDKIYKNKRLMVDRLILKIESCFPTVCDECSVEYKNTIHDSPPLTCFICWQGSHDCQAVQDFQRNIEQLGSKVVGSVWLCSGCREQNALIPTNISKSLQEGEVPTPGPQSNSEEDETETTQEEEGRPSPRRNLTVENQSDQPGQAQGGGTRLNDQTQLPQGKICERYKN